MPRVAGTSTPRYRRHRASGRAVVTICGVDHYLGPYGTKASKDEYDRVVGEWLAAGRHAPIAEADGLTVVELLARHLAFARTYYRKDGKLTDEVSNFVYAVAPLRKMYGRTPAAEFGPLALAAIQQRMIESGLCRSQVNARIGRIRRVFKWGAHKAPASAPNWSATSAASARTPLRPSPPP